MTTEPPVKTAVRAWAVRRLPRNTREREPHEPKGWRYSIEPNPGPVPERPAIRHPQHLLVLDTETNTDASQRLLFGSYRFFRVAWRGDVPELSCREEGLIHGDDVPSNDPDGYARLLEYSRDRPADVDLGADDVQPNLVVLSREQFVDGPFRDIAYKPTGEHFKRASVVGFNLPFDLSRLAWDAIGDPPSREWTFLLWHYLKDGSTQANPFRPRLKILHIDSKRALKRFTGTAGRDIEDMIPEGLTEPYLRYWFRGHLLDLRTLGFALRNKGFTLESACDKFGVRDGKTKLERFGVIDEDSLDYNRNDVRITAELWTKMMSEFLTHPIDLAPEQAFSPASIGAGYLRAMGVTSPRDRLGRTPEDLSWDQVFGASMASYYGGRAECRIRRTSVPVVLVDFTSMYPTVQTLMALEDFLTCEHVDAEDEDAAQVEGWISSLDLETLLDKAAWPELRAIALVEPRGGDVFPIRARYAGTTSSYGIGVNEWGEEPGLGFWYSLPDVIASYLRTGRVPLIRRLIRFSPAGTVEGLREVMFRSAVRLDPRTGIFGPMIDERRRVEHDPRLPPGEGKRISDALKIVANAASYGVFARMDRKEEKTPLAIHGLHSFSPDRSFSPEDPGPLCFPPTAALITGAARLMLMMLEILVERAGGVYAACDTDSMFIVSSELGGVVVCQGGPETTINGDPGIRSIPWSELDEIIGAFDSLNVYEPQNVPDLLKIEDVNFVDGQPESGRRQLWYLGPSAKRYCLYTQSGPDSTPVEFADPAEWIGGEVEEESDFDFDIAKPSDHGLGHLLNPIDPESEDRRWKHRAWDWMLRAELGSEPPGLSFLDLPAVSRTSISTPGAMLPFERQNNGAAYGDRVKPFNFLLTCFPHPDYGIPGKLPRLRLVAPYDKDPERWVDLPWYDANTGQRYSIATTGDGGAGVVRVLTYLEIFQTHLVHEEAKSLGPDGQPCRRDTRGLLRRRRVQMLGRPAHIGKEGNLLEERVRGEIVDEQEYLDEYEDPNWNDFETIVKPAMQLLSSRRLAEVSGLDRVTVKRIRSGRSTGSRDSRSRLFEAVLRLAREELGKQGIAVPPDPLVCLAMLCQQGIDASGAK